MASEPRVTLTLTLEDGDPRAPDILQRTWEREAPSWWRPRAGEWVEPTGEAADTYQIKDVIWTTDALVVELEYHIGTGAPQSRWDEAYESLRRDGFAPAQSAE